MTVRNLLALGFALTLGCDFGVGSWGSWGGGGSVYGGGGGGGGGRGGGDSSDIPLVVETQAFMVDANGVLLGLEGIERTDAFMREDRAFGDYTAFGWYALSGPCAAVGQPPVSLELWNLEDRADAPPDADLGSAFVHITTDCGAPSESTEQLAPTVVVTSEGDARRVVFEADDPELGSFRAELIYNLDCGLPGLPCCSQSTCFRGSSCEAGAPRSCRGISSGVTDAGSSDAGAEAGIADGGIADAGW